MLTLYLMEVTPLRNEKKFKKALELVDGARRERVLSIRQEKNRALSLGAGMLLFLALKEYGQEGAGTAWEEGGVPERKPIIRRVSADQLLSEEGGGCGIVPVQLYKTPTGKLYFADQPGLFFSLSHSGDYALCVLSDREVGADIQVWRSTSGVNLAKKVLHASEWELYARCDTAKQTEIFFSLWAAKEACIKCTGEGLSKAMSELIAEPASGRITDSKTGRSFRFYAIPLLTGYSVAICEAF